MKLCARRVHKHLDLFLRILRAVNDVRGSLHLSFSDSQVLPLHLGQAYMHPHNWTLHIEQEARLVPSS